MNYFYAAVAACILAVALYFAGRKYINILLQRRIAAYHSDLVASHCSEVENIYKTMRGWRHDYHNHIQAMLALVETAGESSSSLRDYLISLNDDLTSIDTVIKTGHVMADAILNSKISLALSKDIAVNVKATVPKNMKIQDIDLCVIIGNLLDNAMEACVSQPANEKRFIRIYIGIHKELFYISVTNSMAGTPEKTRHRYRSTKSLQNHGFGLVRIDKISEKYGGFVDRQHEAGVFATEIMLPL